MNNSFLRRNAAFCARRYNCKFFDANGNIANIQPAAKSYNDNLIEDRQICTSGFVYELILLRQNDLVLSSNVDLSFDELDQLVYDAYTG